jgi:hypothetical protein
MDDTDEDGGLPRPALRSGCGEEEGEYFPGYGSNGDGSTVAASPRTHILRAFTAHDGVLSKLEFTHLLQEMGLPEAPLDALEQCTDEEGRYLCPSPISCPLSFL